VKSLNEAKGLPVKVAQMMGYFDFNMPYAVREVFASLRNQGIPMNPLTIAQVIKEDLGAPPSQVFAHWEATPFAAASIGQVHRARLKSGEQAAVKVQYPGIQETIEFDMGSISILGKLSNLVLRGGDGAAIISEIKEHLLQECDYEREASNQEFFSGLFQDHPAIVIPKIHRKYSTKRVIVSAFHEGLSLESFAGSASQEEKNRAAEALWDFFNVSKFKHGFFHCDPHAGNFIFSGKKVVCLDFGCVKKVPKEYRKHMIGQAIGIANQNRKVLREAIEGMGIIDRPREFNFESHFHFLNIVGAPFQPQQPFRYSDDYRRALWHAIQTNPNQKYTKLPKEEVMALRCHLGELSNYALLNAESNWRERLLSLLGA